MIQAQQEIGVTNKILMITIDQHNGDEAADGLWQGVWRDLANTNRNTNKNENTNTNNGDEAADGL